MRPFICSIALLLIHVGCAQPPAASGLTSVDQCPKSRTADDPAVTYFRPLPRYPTRALFQRVSGRVLVEGTITRKGHFVFPKVIAYEPSPIFNYAAIEAVLQWRYCPVPEGSPGYKNPYRVAIPFVYQ
jgi:TonB family protein